MTLRRRLDRIEDHICDCFGSDTPTALDRHWIRLLDRNQHIAELRRYFERKEAEIQATFEDTKDPYGLELRDVNVESTPSDPSPANGSLDTTNPAGRKV